MPNIFINRYQFSGRKIKSLILLRSRAQCPGLQIPGSEGQKAFTKYGNLLSNFNNNVELAKHLNISKFTVGKYLNFNFIYINYYYFKFIVDKLGFCNK